VADLEINNTEMHKIAALLILNVPFSTSFVLYFRDSRANHRAPKKYKQTPVLGGFHICFRYEGKTALIKKMVSSIRTPVFIQGRLERTETKLMHLKWEVAWKHENQPNSF